MWRETIETSNSARCRFCSEITLPERASAPAGRCAWCAQDGATSRMNDNYFDLVMRVRPARRSARSHRAA